MGDAASLGWRSKVDWLSQPAAYAPPPASVAIVETHFAFVFLAGDFVYKLKKPLRFRDFDFTTLAARRASCELEVVLNRRLAPEVYIGVAPLTAERGSFVLEGSGTPVEWLVKMRRLPQERTLERLAIAGAVREEDLAALSAKLAAFYARAERAAWDGAAYRAALRRDIDRCATELSAPDLALDTAAVATFAADLRDTLVSIPELFDARVAAGRIVDTHGDLRPEHVFLTAPEPQIIDCLEFSAALRLQDSAAEIAFLALECERLEQPALATRLLALYGAYCHDDVHPCLLAFYRKRHALTRAVLAAWRLPDAPPVTAQHWRERTLWYLGAARRESYAA